MAPGGAPALGPHHHEVKRLRALLRDRAARREQRALVLEGPRLVGDALRRGVPLEAVYLGPSAERAFRSLVDAAQAAAVPARTLKEGVLEKVGTTRTPQPVLAVAAAPPSANQLPETETVLALVEVSDPGNLGALLRSAEAVGACSVVCCGETVDPYNPKVVRASAGAIFGVPVVEAADPAAVLDALGERGWWRIGATATGGEPYTRAALGGRVAFVLGSEAHGLPDVVGSRLDSRVTIPMAGDLESLNLAVAGSVLVFEAARQRANDPPVGKAAL